MSLDLPPIPASAAKVVPPTEEKIFGQWWLDRLVVMANAPGRPVQAMAHFLRARVDETGAVVETLPASEGEAVLSIDDLLGLAQDSPAFAKIVAGLMEQIVALGHARGVL